MNMLQSFRAGNARANVQMLIAAMLSLAGACAHAQGVVGDTPDFAIYDSATVTGKPVPKYVANGQRWTSHQVTWYYNPANASGALTTAQVLSGIEAAMAQWSSVCNITFTYAGTTGTGLQNFDNTNVIGWDASIGSAGLTSWSYDGSNGILDADIAINPTQGSLQLLFADIITHEVGHMLGLSHSNVQDAVMAGPPLTQYNANQHTLRADDIAGCVSLYGPPAGGGTGGGGGGGVTPPSPEWDLFWRNANGTNATWQFTGALPSALNTAFPPGVPSNWQAKAVKDVNGDGINDVIWLDPNSGLVAIWIMGSPSTIASATFPASVGAGGAWSFAGAGDLNGDGKTDIVWRNNSTGQVRVWFMNGAGTIASFTDYSSPTTYQLSGVGDTDANGFADLIWFEPATGQVAVWLMGPGGATPTFPASVGPGAWRPYGIGDLDGDGRADILWRNQDTGGTAVWYMSGGAVASTQSFVSVPIATWQFGAIADLDLDGRDDIVWFSAAGDVVRWRMLGRGVQPITESLTSVGPGWSLVP